jgi:hypothetical protein
MSDNIKKRLEGLEGARFIIEQSDFNYLNSLDQIRRTNDHYMDQLMSEYLKIISVRLGYLPEKDLEFNIDLKDPKRELLIKDIPIPLEDQLLDKG